MLTLAYVLCVLASVIGTAWYGNKAPFFPIELSRLAATDQLTSDVFRYGSGMMLLPLLLEGRTGVFSLLSWVGVFGVACFDDIAHPTGHFISIGVMIIACLLSINRTNWRFKGFLMAYSIWIMLARLVLVCSALLYFELKETKIYDYPLQVIKHRKYLVDTSLKIMYEGYNTPLQFPDIVMHTFKVKAVMQWIAYAIMAVAMLSDTPVAPIKLKTK